MYNPVLGRFMTRDPIAENGGVNLYAYCQNDPVNCADPEGLEAIPTTMPASAPAPRYLQIALTRLQEEQPRFDEIQREYEGERRYHEGEMGGYVKGTDREYEARFATLEKQFQTANTRYTYLKSMYDVAVKAQASGCTEDDWPGFRLANGLGSIPAQGAKAAQDKVVQEAAKAKRTMETAMQTVTTAIARLKRLGVAGDLEEMNAQGRIRLTDLDRDDSGTMGFTPALGGEIQIDVNFAATGDVAILAGILAHERLHLRAYQAGPAMWLGQKISMLVPLGTDDVGQLRTLGEYYNHALGNLVTQKVREDMRKHPKLP
jgi:hypothetical protein